MARTLNGERAWPWLVVLLALLALRLYLAASLPLAYDEAYYWLWSTQLAPGYFDHPPMVAFVIRAGTALFGQTEFGVRIMSVLFAIPASWLVWRTALVLFQDKAIAARATLYFNLTLLVNVGLLIATPDAPLLLATALALYCLAQLAATQRPHWWLAIGVAVGLGLLSKYTAFFTGFSIALWLVCTPSMRHWLRTPWPYLAGMLTLALFTPVVWWNMQHDYASFAKQFGRAVSHGFTLRYEPGLWGEMIGLLGPPIFILAFAGLWRSVAHRTGIAAGPWLLGVMIMPLMLYFSWHALHANVEGNWLLPMFPAAAIAAAWGASFAANSRMLRAARLSAMPVGIVLFGALVLHTIMPVYVSQDHDYTSRKLGFGISDLARNIEAIRVRENASAVTADNYSTTSWLSFYLPPGSRVLQLGDPIRWVNFEGRDPATLAVPFLYVTDEAHDQANNFPLPGKTLTLLVTLTRVAHGVELKQYRVYRVASMR